MNDGEDVFNRLAAKTKFLSKEREKKNVRPQHHPDWGKNSSATLTRNIFTQNPLKWNTQKIKAVHKREERPFVIDVSCLCEKACRAWRGENHKRESITYYMDQQ